MQQKSSVLSFDDLVALTADFYTSDEIRGGAVTTVYNYVDQRPPAHKTADKERKIVADILKLILNPNVEQPMFFSVDISRLLPVDVEHMDMSALLKDLGLLRSEVSAITNLRIQMEEMKSAVKIL